MYDKELLEPINKNESDLENIIVLRIEDKILSYLKLRVL